MGNARNRWKAVAEARRSGDTMLFWNKLMSAIGRAFITLTITASIIIYLIYVLRA